MNNLKGVIFDLWNTLVYSPPGQTLKARIAEYSGISIDMVTEYIRLIYSVRADIDFHDFCKILYSECKMEFNGNVAKDLKTIYNDTLQNVNWMPGAKEILEKLNDHNIKLAIVSNSSEFSLKVVDKFELNNYVDEIYISCLSGYLKPDPRAFNSVLEKWGHRNGICVVGDKMTTDVLGAKILDLDVLLLNKDVFSSTLLENVSIVGITKSMHDVYNLLNIFYQTKRSQGGVYYEINKI